MQWFIDNHADMPDTSTLRALGSRGARLLSLVSRPQLKRSWSGCWTSRNFVAVRNTCVVAIHADHRISRRERSCEPGDYEPAESRTGTFGGNSNWRGPIWFPVNFLLIEALQKFHHYYGEDFKIEFPTRSGVESICGMWRARYRGD